MINMKISRSCGGELEHSISFRCVEPFSTEDYINEMEDISTQKRIGKTWTINPMESKAVSKYPKEDEIPENPVLKCHKCMRPDLIDVLYTYKHAFASDNEPLGTIRGHDVDITLNIDRPYSPVLRRPAYPESPRAREALERQSKS
ncbi:hypothetical protein O181_083698 [Austropuccinia psidii MF-1]|uniref:Uncharacterized protein n=1 Tax=Austropuccinia psidii MF-1 TaxID=1389203 RepID=A0A9Q3IJU1_9BASI|nr:hypothetical protein [Austropuccinia psidii MF-1]